LRKKWIAHTFKVLQMQFLGVSSSKEEKDEGNGDEGGRSSGHEKLAAEPNLILETYN
jgi:hypothetical protein